MTTLIRRWGLAALVALLTMMFYQFYISPTLAEWQADWLFLHEARMQAIQQIQQQRAVQAQPQPQK